MMSASMMPTPRLAAPAVSPTPPWLGQQPSVGQSTPGWNTPFGNPIPVGSPMVIGNPVTNLVSQLGMGTRIGLDGLVQFNEPLVQAIAAYREQAVSALYQTLSTTVSVPVLLEGVYTAQQLAQKGVKGIDGLYPAVSRWNTNPDPLVQIFLAGFYRYLNIPTTFGPMLATLMNRAVHQYPLQGSGAFNITEEVGGTILEQIAQRTADATVQKLLPYLNTRQPQTPNSNQTVN